MYNDKHARDGNEVIPSLPRVTLTRFPTASCTITPATRGAKGSRMP